MRQEAHALAGSARNVGLTRLGEAAAALQEPSSQALPDSGAVAAVAAAFDEASAARLPLGRRAGKPGEPIWDNVTIWNHGRSRGGRACPRFSDRREIIRLPLTSKQEDRP